MIAIDARPRFASPIAIKVASRQVSLLGAITVAQSVGWAWGIAAADEVKAQGQSIGWIPRVSRGSGESEELRPIKASHAHPASLSAIYGMGPQPLHTDCAHLEQPPRWLLLMSVTSSEVPTCLWTTALDEATPEVREAMFNGIFTIVSGQRSFLAPAQSQQLMRFDPGCMRPSDGLANRAWEFLSARDSAVVSHHWSAPHMFLLIDNHRALHGRGDATSEPGRVLERVAFDLAEGDVL